MNASKLLYHGSSVKGLKQIKPFLDKRTGIKAVFLSDERFGPMIFSLLNERHNSTVNLTTKKGKFISGRIITKKPLRKQGWLYTVQVKQKDLHPTPRLHTTIPLKVISVKKVTKEDVLKLGWKIKVKK